MKYYIFSLLVAAANLSAATWRPNEHFLNAVRMVESSEGRLLSGDQGRSLGEFQMSEAAWADVSDWRQERGLPTYSYRRYVFNKAVSRSYAADYLSILQSELRKRLKRAPSSAEIYAAYNMGLASFAECRYQLARVNPVTAKRCRQIQQMTQARH